jgi:hypothetical protein
MSGLKRTGYAALAGVLRWIASAAERCLARARRAA